MSNHIFYFRKIRNRFTMFHFIHSLLNFKKPQIENPQNRQGMFNSYNFDSFLKRSFR